MVTSDWDAAKASMLKHRRSTELGEPLSMQCKSFISFTRAQKWACEPKSRLRTSKTITATTTTTKRNPNNRVEELALETSLLLPLPPPPSVMDNDDCFDPRDSSAIYMMFTDTKCLVYYSNYKDLTQVLDCSCDEKKNNKKKRFLCLLHVLKFTSTRPPIDLTV